MPCIAVRRTKENHETILLKKFKNEIPYNIGECNNICEHCGAAHWLKEKVAAKGITSPAHYSMCCRGGQVELPQHYFNFPPVPEFLQDLLTEDDAVSRRFRDNIRAYNNGLSFTSLGTEIDHSVNGPYGVRCFKMKGQLVHKMGTILPADGKEAAFAQIYVMGPELEDEAGHRVNMTGVEGLDVNIMKALQDFMDEYNPYAKQFRSAYKIWKRDDTVTIRLKTIPPTAHMTANHDIQTYARPLTSEVAMVVGNDSDIGGGERDIILTSNERGWERISDLHTGYLPLRYPVLFPYGQAGYDSYYWVPSENSEFC
ncbi:uncharacterized protein MELLADRAFT_104602 [Melampsora larici-populina 98AG31]|uniref:Helitron helicase-like domain-containing protein n=1 Tax=Melampsora larici-populina (strain 98AG31 / pathotype 3-4-7) TaxID=747676 RepID=F4RF94_MELLP|nr:uncharacterized protein MELLADRAFT_104602 [Melampsora larici-populina 98AG31]EGG08773.1 hypothetical protein MELLADRAFT_104602 [Melampsora larici-populina 98AG31]